MKKIFTGTSLLVLSFFITGCTELTKDPNSASDRITFKDNVTINYGTKNVDTTKFVTNYDTYRVTDTNRQKKEHKIEMDNYTIICPKFSATKMGKHTLVYKMGNFKYNLTVTVKDKEKPVIQCKSDVDFTVGDKIDKKKLFVVTDNLSKEKDIKKTYKGKIGKKAGIYKVTCIAKDEASNKSSSTVTVHIYDKPTIIIKEKSFNMIAGQNKQIEVNVTGKENRCSYSSSNSNVATVNENGVITAISTGNASIIVSANGIQETVTVNVENTQTKTNNQNQQKQNSNTNIQSGNTKKHSGSSNPSQYNKYFSGNSIDNYNSAYDYAESILASGKAKGYSVMPDGNGFNVTFN